MVKVNSLFLILMSLYLLGNAQGKPIYISLKNEKMRKLPNSDINIVKVIDARENKNMIGFVQKGLSNNRRMAMFKQSTDKELEDFIKCSIPYTPHGKNVLLRLTEFFIGENTQAFTEVAELSFGYEFYHLLNDSTLTLIHSSSIKMKSASALDVTKLHPSLIAEAIRKSIFELYSIKTLLGSRQYSIEQLKKAGYIEEQLFPIQTARSLRKGYYTNLESFRSNEPMAPLTSFRYPFCDGCGNEILSPKDLIIESDTFEKLNSNSIFGFCDGNNVYVKNENGNFGLVFRKGTDVFIWQIVKLHDPDKYSALGVFFATEKKLRTHEMDLQTGTLILSK